MGNHVIGSHWALKYFAVAKLDFFPCLKAKAIPCLKRAGPRSVSVDKDKGFMWTEKMKKK